MVNIICVYKSGNFKQGYINATYKPEHVLRLKKQVEENVTTPFKFYCLSDVEIEGVEVIPLTDNLKGWWSKVEIFKHFEDFLYLDLDITILRNIDELIKTQGKFLAYEDALKKGELNSSIMRVRGNYRFIYDIFIQNKLEIMRGYTTNKKWGDQKFIEDCLDEFEFFDNKYFHSFLFDKKTKTNELIEIYCGNIKPWGKNG